MLKQIAAVILAAGSSTRFGQPKQLLDWNGEPLVTRITNIALKSGLDPIIVTLGYRAQHIRPLIDDRPVDIVMNWRWREGLSTSLQAGLGALPPDIDAAVFIQSDQPLITPDLISHLIARYEHTGASIVVPRHAGRPGSPVLFSRELFAELAGVTGDVGGRHVIKWHPEMTSYVEIEDPDILEDIDTPDDYLRLLRRGLGDDHHPAASAETADGEALLSTIRHLIIDMDGVLWHADVALPGIQDFFLFLREQTIEFILATNNSSRTPDQYTEKLARFGVDVAPDKIVNSSEATAVYLSTIAQPGAKVYAVGEEGVRRALEKYGFTLCEENASYVVVGWNRDLRWKHLATASLLIHGGAQFIGTNPDTSFPTERGPVPGNGAQLAAIEITTGIKPIVVGKPEPGMYLEALRRMNASPRTTAVIGDRLDTDILGGIRANLTGILVLSGITTREAAAESEIKPDLICTDTRDLVRIWREHLDKSIGRQDSRS